MSVVTAREIPATRTEIAPRRTPRKRWTRFILPTYSVLMIIYLMVPIAVMILYSFNSSGFKKVSFRWLGFTTYWYRHLFDIPDLTAAMTASPQSLKGCQ